ncbi:MAG: SgcJ/EcaC family oxidoreductase [Acidobacteriales bacterium]|nr:SgcJ/EcaC family oxidoreductase [Terriglobales bacterium]
MRLSRITLPLLLIVLASSVALPQSASTAADRRSIEQLNHELDDAILHMSNERVLALWADDGVTLLPGMAPVEGKKNITEFMQKVVAGMPGFHVTEQQTDIRNIEVSGDWAAEWGLTHQIATPPDGKAPIDSRGKIMLILHRESDGHWKIKQEMWNTDAKP